MRGVLAALVAVPLLATPAYAEEYVVPGCWGVEDAVVCEPGVNVRPGWRLEKYRETVTVCAMTCEDHEVTLVRLVRDGLTYVCPTYEDREGDEQVLCR